MEHFSFHNIGALRLLVCDPLERIGFKNAFSTRLGGVSPLPADALDLGAESTRPGAVPIDAVTELARLLPVLERVVALGVPVSVDTTKAAVAARALAGGATIINDVSGLERDPELPARRAHGDRDARLVLRARLAHVGRRVRRGVGSDVRNAPTGITGQRQRAANGGKRPAERSADDRSGDVTVAFD